MKPRNNADLPRWSKEPLHCARKVLVLKAHPVAVCCYNACIEALIGDSPGIGGESCSPFMWPDVNFGGTFWARKITLDVEGYCA